MAKQQKIIIYFFIKAIALYLIWYFIYEKWLMKVGWLDNIIIDNLVNLNNKILSFIGYETFIYGHVIGIQGSHGVFIGTPCNGIDLMALFVGFILIFQGSWKNKIWFISLGMIIIHALNLFRVAALTIMAKSAPELLDFNHKYTFTIILYGIVFIGWMIWVKKYARPIS